MTRCFKQRRFRRGCALECAGLEDFMRKRNALLSCANKTKPDLGLFAQGLEELGFVLYGSQGTVRHLHGYGNTGIMSGDIAELVGRGPILDHKVVTLSTEIAAGCLVDSNNPKEMTEFAGLGKGFVYFDLVLVDFYALEEEINRPGADAESVRNKTDIGGPTLASEAAKGQRIIICDRRDEMPALRWLQQGEPNGDVVRQRLRAKADYWVGRYRLLSAKFLDYPNLVIPPLPPPLIFPQAS